MQFGNFSAAAWAFLAIPIVIFYILKIRLRRVPIATTMFWEQIFEEKKPRSIWQQLRHLLSLLLQLIFLMLLVGALVDPFLDLESLKPRRIVLVVDNSASMTTEEGGTPRLDLAKQEGHRLIRGLRLRDELAIVSAGSVPHVETGLTSHQRTLREALDGIPATDGPTNVSAATAIAQRLVADHPNSQIRVLTDGGFDSFQEMVDDESVEVVLVGESSNNVGITQFQVRRSFRDPASYEMLVEVTNHSDEAVSCSLTVDLQDTSVVDENGNYPDPSPLDAVEIDLKPGEVWSETLQQATQLGGKLIARVQHDDALAVDNEAFALLPQIRRQKVYLVTDKSWFVRWVFTAMSGVDLEIVEELPSERPADSIVVFHGKTPEQLPGGNIFVIEPVASTQYWTLGEKIQDPLIAEQEKDHELMKSVTLSNVFMPGARKLGLKDEASSNVLMKAIGGEPILVAIESGKSKTIVLTVALTDKNQTTNFPLRAHFPILFENAVRWFQGRRGELLQSVATGTTVDVELKETMESIVREWELRNGQKWESESDDFVVVAPDGSETPVPSGVDETTIGPLQQRGVWSVRPVVEKPDDGQDAKPYFGPQIEYACNLSNTRESNLKTPDVDIPPVESAIFNWGGRPIWFYLIAIALVLTTMEWFLYQRRYIS